MWLNKIIKKKLILSRLEDDYQYFRDVLNTYSSFYEAKIVDNNQFIDQSQRLLLHLNRIKRAIRRIKAL